MLSRVVIAENVYGGIVNTTQSYGLAGMMPNTVIMGWGEQTDHPAEFTKMIRRLIALDRNLVLVSHDAERSFGKQRTIDVWWGGLERNSQLMMLIAFLIASSPEWSNVSIRLLIAVSDEKKLTETKERLDKLVSDSRFAAEPVVVPHDNSVESIPELINRTSADTDLVILGLRPPKEHEDGEYVRHVNGFLGKLGTTLLVRASSQFEGGAILFDEEHDGQEQITAPPADLSRPN